MRSPAAGNNHGSDWFKHTLAYHATTRAPAARCEPKQFSRSRSHQGKKMERDRNRQGGRSPTQSFRASGSNRPKVRIASGLKSRYSSATGQLQKRTAKFYFASLFWDRTEAILTEPEPPKQKKWSETGIDKEGEARRRAFAPAEATTQK